MRSIPSPIRILFFVVVPFFAILFLIADQLSNDLSFSSKSEEYNFYKATNQKKRATETVLASLNKNDLNIENHITFVNHYLYLNDKDKNLIRNKFERLFKKSPFEYYTQFSKANNEDSVSIGYYGLSTISISRTSTSKNDVLDYFDKINYNHPGIYELKGNYYFSVDSMVVAEKYFKKVLFSQPDLTRVKEMLARVYITKGEYQRAFDLIGFDINCDSGLRYYVAKENSAFSSIQLVYYNGWKGMVNWSVIGSSIILLFWMLFVKTITFDYKKLFVPLAIVLFLIFLITPALFLITDLFGQIKNPFLYNLIHVALLEELLKLSIVYVVFFYFKYKKYSLNPVKYISFGILSASVFAFFENNLYFNQYADSAIIFVRFVNTSFMHVICTTTLVVGIFYNNIFSVRNFFLKVGLIILPFLIHAVYNASFGLTFSLFQIIVIVAFILWIHLLNRILKLNDAKILKTNFNVKLSNLILINLPVIILVQYVFTFFEFGAKVSEKIMYSSIQNFGFMLLISSAAVLKINDFKYFREEVFSNKSKYKIKYLNLSPLDSISRTHFKSEFKVNIEQKIVDSNKLTWYVVSSENDKYLIRIKDSYVDLDEYKIKVICLQLKESSPKDGLNTKSFSYLGILKSSPVL
jgi:tetratricopeptide (TPR) repeat protein